MTETWAVVLAGGEGARLRTITTNPQGVVIPKQYCSLGPSSCLLQDAIARVSSVAMPSHICTVVAAHHRQWWSSAVSGLSESNVIVQPQSKGTGFGILLALLTLEMRNPQATLILLPADHYFRDEDTIVRALRVASNLAGVHEHCTYLLGADPEGPDPELGYILPMERTLAKPASIAGFAEKPTQAFARELISLGALWNLFILAGSVKALLQLFSEDHADAVAAMREALQHDAGGGSGALQTFYQTIEPIDFSRHILEVQAHRLQVVRVQHCGWTDLGTPKRVAATLRELAANADAPRQRAARSAPLFFDLGAQH